MAEDLTRTLEQVVTGFQGGQATAALLNQSVMSPLGLASVATPPPPAPVFTPPPPPVLPNLVAYPSAPMEPAMMANPTQAFASNSVSMPAMGMTAGPVPMMATPQPPPMMPPMMPPQPVSPMGGMFQQGMAMAQQNQISNPAMAMYMSQQGGMMPDANMMMASQYGNLRQDVMMDRRTVVPLGIPGGGQGLPNAFLPWDTFQRTRPQLQFARGYDAALYQGLETQRLLEQGYNAYAQAGAERMVNAVVTPITMAAGAAIGGYFGGARGAMTGADVGMMAGQFANDIPGVNTAVQALMGPALRRRADAIQAQYASRQFLIGGGADIDISGTGLSGTAAQRLTRGMEDIARGSDGALTRQDAVMLMQAGGEQGILDWAQNADQIVASTKTMTKVLGAMAEITGDPDFMTNLKKMGALSRMGIGLNDQMQAVRNMDQYARMAGMDIDQLMQNEGLQGAQMFKAAGLGAGIGMQNRMFTAAQARQLVAGGAFSEQALDLYGGTEGVGQTMAEINAAYLSKVAQPLMGYMVGGRDAQGNFTIDQAKLNKLASGGITYEQALQEGANRNFSPTDLADMMAQMKELTTQVGKQLGPEGIQRAALQAAIDMSNNSNGQLSLRAAAQTIYGEAGGAIVARMTNPEYQAGVMSQMDAEMRRREFEADAAERQGPGRASLLARMGINFENPNEWIDRRQRRYSDWLSDMEEGARFEAVGVTRYSRGVDVEGFSGGGAIRAGQASSDAYRNDMFQNAYRKVVSGFGQDIIRGIGAEDAVMGVLGDAGNVVEGRLNVFGAEREMSRYLRGRSGVIGTIDDLIRDSGISDEDRRREDDRDVRAYRLAAGGDKEALARGRAELEQLLGGREGVAAAGGAIGARQGDTFLGENVSGGLISAALMANPLGVMVGGATAVAQLAGYNPFGRSDTGMADERIAKETGLSIEQVRGMSSEAKAALIQEAKLMMTSEEEAAFDVETRDVVNAGMGERIGQHYLRSGADAMKRLDEALGNVGLDEYEDLSQAEKNVVTAIAGSGTEQSRKYLAIAALLAAGGADKKALANRLYQELAKTDEGAADKLRQAKRLVSNMDPETRDALIANIEGLVGGSKSIDDLSQMSPEEALQHMEQQLQQITEAGEGVQQVERFAATRAKLEDVGGLDLEGVDDDLSLMERIQTASGEDLEIYRRELGDEAVDLARSGDTSQEALTRFAGLTSKATGAGGGSIEVSSKRGATSDATQEQADLIAAQRSFFAQLNSATVDNTNVLSATSRQLATLNANLAGEGAETIMKKARGPGKRK